MNILAIYGSNTGNTKSLMLFIKEVFKKSVDCNYNLIDAKNIKDVTDFSPYNLVILSSATWGGISPTLQDDFEKFWINLDKSTIKGHTFAVVGLGDLYYKEFCKAVDFISDDIIKYKGKLLVDSLAISDEWSHHKKFIVNWLEQILTNLKNISVGTPKLE